MSPDNEMLWLERGVLLTLWIEFFYDLFWNNREAQLKRRKSEKAKNARNKITVGNPLNLEPEQRAQSSPQ